MLSCKINKLSGEVIEHREACHGTLKRFRIAYFTEASREKLAKWNNKPAVRKYYPKKIVSVNSSIIRLPANFKTSTKCLKSLKIEHLQDARGSLLKSNRYSDVQFRKIILASRRIKRLEVKHPLANRALQGLRCLKNLKSLDINLCDQQLPAITNIMNSLKGLESISLLFQRKDNAERHDPGNFLAFCEKVLGKKHLRVFNIDFDMNTAYYSTEAFERLFQLIEGSKVERWNICTMLAENQVLGMAEKYKVFRQAEHIAIHPQNVIYFYAKGITQKYLTKIGYSGKILNIYLKDYFKGTNFAHDLEPVVKQCPKLEHLHVSWRDNMPKHYTLRNDDFRSYQSLKIINFKMHWRKDDKSWTPLLKILEHSPYLEKFSLETEKFVNDHTSEAETEANGLRSYVNALAQIKTLNSVRFKIHGLSQEGLDVLGGIFEALKGLKELKIRLQFQKRFNSLMPKVWFQMPFPKLTQLTQLRLWLPYFSPESYFESLSNSIPNLNALRILTFRNQGDKPIQWMAIEALMKKLRQLPELNKFTFSSQIEFEDHDDDVERNAIIMAEEVVSLVGLSRVLEFVKIIDSKRISVEYAKEIKTKIIL